MSEDLVAETSELETSEPQTSKLEVLEPEVSKAMEV